MDQVEKKGWIPENLYHEIKKLLPIPCIDLLIINEGKLLLMQRNNQPGKDEWFTPGGRILKGERLEEAVYRILEEETGLTPISIMEKGAMTHIWPMIQTVTVLYRVEVTNDLVRMNEEHSRYKWVSEASEELHKYVKEMIERAEIF